MQYVVSAAYASEYQLYIYIASYLPLPHLFNVDYSIMDTKNKDNELPICGLWIYEHTLTQSECYSKNWLAMLEMSSGIKNWN